MFVLSRICLVFLVVFLGIIITIFSRKNKTNNNKIKCSATC